MCEKDTRLEDIDPSVTTAPALIHNLFSYAEIGFIIMVMKDPDILTSLRECGMTEREIKLYLAMLEKSEATAPELHRISGVLRTKTYETLERMVAKGFCIDRVESKRRYYRAVSPSELEEVLKHQWHKELQTKEGIAQPVFSHLEDRFKSAIDSDRSLDFVEVIRSQDQIQHRFKTLLSESKNEVLVFNRSPYISINPAMLKDQEKVVVKMLERGLRIKTVYLDEDEHRSWLGKHILAMQKAGEESRITDDLPMKMVILDRKQVFIALPYSAEQNHRVNFTNLLVEDSGFTSACVTLFDFFWNRSHEPDAWFKKTT